MVAVERSREASSCRAGAGSFGAGLAFGAVGVVAGGDGGHPLAVGPVRARELGGGGLPGRGPGLLLGRRFRGGPGRLPQILVDHRYAGCVGAEHQQVRGGCGGGEVLAVEVEHVAGGAHGALHDLLGAQLLAGGGRDALAGRAGRAAHGLGGHQALERVGVALGGQGEAGVGHMQVGGLRGPVGDPFDLHHADGGGQLAAVARLGPAALDVVRAGQGRDARLGPGAGVQVVLHQLPLQLAPGLAQPVLQFLLRGAHHHRPAHVHDHVVQTGAGGGVVIDIGRRGAVGSHRVSPSC